MYFRCGFMKVIPLHGDRVPNDLEAGHTKPVFSLKPFCIHHMPNKYVKEGVTLIDKFHLTVDGLLRWLDVCVPESRLGS